MRATILENLLKKEGKTPDTVIKWAYYGYGFLNCTGENKISELPSRVKRAKCFKVEGNIYFVDGAL